MCERSSLGHLRFVLPISSAPPRRPSFLSDLGSPDSSELRAHGSGALRCIEDPSEVGKSYSALQDFSARANASLELCSKINLPERESRLLSVGPSADETTTAKSVEASVRVWFRPLAGSRASSHRIVIWLILPVAICLSQRLSHACPSTSLIKVKPRMAH